MPQQINLGDSNYDTRSVSKETFPRLLSRAAHSTNPCTTVSSFAKVAVRRTCQISDSFTVGLSTITGTKTAREHQARAGELIEVVDLQLLFQFLL